MNNGRRFISNLDIQPRQGWAPSRPTPPKAEPPKAEPPKAEPPKAEPPKAKISRPRVSLVAPKFLNEDQAVFASQLVKATSSRIDWKHIAVTSPRGYLPRPQTEHMTPLVLPGSAETLLSNSDVIIYWDMPAPENVPGIHLDEILKPVIPWDSRPEVSREEVRSMLRLKDDDIAVGMSYEMLMGHNPYALAWTVRRLNEISEGKYVAVWMGEGNLLLEVRDAAHQALGYDGRFRFTGAMDVVAACDVILSPTIDDRSMNVDVLKAWAYGVPVVATPVGKVCSDPENAPAFLRVARAPSVSPLLTETVDRLSQHYAESILSLVEERDEAKARIEIGKVYVQKYFIHNFADAIVGKILEEANR